MDTRKAFTMIELVFVIVVLGILAAIAVPKFAATRDDAHVSKAKATVAAVRSGIINERQARLFRGNNTYIAQLDATAANTVGAALFSNVLAYGITSSDKSGGWMKTAANEYTISINAFNNNAVFDYNTTTGSFSCADTGGDLCGVLSN